MTKAEMRYVMANTLEGWKPIVRALIRQISGHVKWRKLEHFAVQQVKEKFGGLRFYISGGDYEIAGMISMAEAMSVNTCEVCGCPGERRGGGWIRTLCDTHDKERNG